MPNPMGWPDWLWELEQPFLPPDPTPKLTPIYLPQQFVIDGAGNQEPIAIYLFPDSTTCQALITRYNPNGSIVYRPFIETSSVPNEPQIPMLVWPNGVAIAAGMLAQLWTQNQDSPSTADTLVKQAITARGAQ